MCPRHACRRRTGSAFGLQAGYQADRARIEGRSHEYARTATEPDRRVPSVSVYGVRRHRWLPLPEGIEHDEVWSELQSLYGAGDVACCESMAGRAGDAPLG